MKIEARSFETLNYLVCVPDAFLEKEKYPIIIHLHGAGSRGSDVSILKNQAIMSYATKAKDFPFVMFLPQCSANCWFDVFEQLKAFVKSLVDLPFVDKSKVYLSGVSMGGYASWQLLMSENTIFNKAIICCGGGMYWNAARIKAKVWAFHGKDDPTVYFEESQKMVNAVNQHDGCAKLTSYDGVGHNCWDPTYSNPEIYAWLLS